MDALPTTIDLKPSRLLLATIQNVRFGLAEAHDAEELANVFAEFFGQSSYPSMGIEYDWVRARDWLRGVISSGYCPHLVARFDDVIVGVISYLLDDSFSKAPVAVMNTIYVREPYRRTAVGRILVALAVDLAKADGACAFNACSTSGMEETSTLKNMFTKAGFSPVGFVMTRGL